MNFIILIIPFIVGKNIKANRNLKVPQLTADYLLKCQNIYTYFLD